LPNYRADVFGYSVDFEGAGLLSQRKGNGGFAHAVVLIGSGALQFMKAWQVAGL